MKREPSEINGLVFLNNKYKCIFDSADHHLLKKELIKKYNHE